MNDEAGVLLFFVHEVVSCSFVRMQESVLLKLGFFTKTCVVLACLCGVHLIVALFFYLTESPTKLTNYHKIKLDSDIFTSETHKTAVSQYDNGTEVDVNRLIYSNGSVVKDAVEEEPAVLGSCPETSTLLGKLNWN